MPDLLLRTLHTALFALQLCSPMHDDACHAGQGAACFGRQETSAPPVTSVTCEPRFGSTLL